MLKLDRLTLEPRFIDRNICFCNGGSDTSGDEPDGVTFTSGPGYKPGDGISISSDTLAANSTDDTYGGFNTSPARQAEIFGTGTYNDQYETGTGADPNLGYVSGVTGDAEFTGAPSVASGALASLDDSFNLSPAASPSQNLTAEQKAIVETALSRGEQPPDFSKPMTVAELAREKELEDIFSETNLDPAAGQEEQRARNEQEMADRAVALNAINDMLGISRAQGATAQDVLGGGISTITGPISRPQMQGPPQMPDTVYDSDMGMVGSGTSAPTGDLYGGYEDDPAYDADIFGTPRYAGGITGLDGKLQGFDMTGYTGRSDQPRDPNVSSMGDFVDTATRGGVLGKVTDYGIIPNVISAITGQTPMDMRRDSVREFFEAGAQFNPESGKMELPAGKGMLKMSDSGMVTYSGQPDPNYTGMYSNLVNPSTGGGGGGGSMTDATGAPVNDPCPPGYKMVDGSCQPDGTSTDGSQAGVGSTTFSPFYTPQQVATINPFVLQPYPNQTMPFS